MEQHNFWAKTQIVQIRIFQQSQNSKIHSQSLPSVQSAATMRFQSLLVERQRVRGTHAAAAALRSLRDPLGRGPWRPWHLRTVTTGWLTKWIVWLLILVERTWKPLRGWPTVDVDGWTSVGGRMARGVSHWSPHWPCNYVVRRRRSLRYELRCMAWRRSTVQHLRPLWCTGDRVRPGWIQLPRLGRCTTLCLV